MLRIEDLLLQETVFADLTVGPLEADPWSEEGALLEAQVLDLRFDALTGVLGVLFELRQALQLQRTNTGVLIARGVRGLSWSGPRWDAPLTAWSVQGSVLEEADGLRSLRLEMSPLPGAQLGAVFERALFVAADVPGLDAAPPDYGDHDRSGLVGQVAGWSSPFEPVGAAFWGPGRR